MTQTMDSSWFEGLGLRSRPLCRAWIDVEPASPFDLGEGPWRRLFAAYIKGGRFEGDELRGEVLPGGGDWPMLSQGGGVQAVDTRAVWRTHDGAMLYLAYGGRINISPEVRRRVAEEGAANVPASEYYFRSLPLFETADPRYTWLNELVSVAVGRLTDTGIVYQLHAVE